MRQLLIIACNPRSGSSLLCEALDSTGLAGHPDEWFLPRRIIRWGLRHGVPTASPRIIPALIRYQLNGRSPQSENFLSSIAARQMPRYYSKLTDIEVTANGVFGIQLHRGQYILANDFWGVDVVNPKVPTTWVHLRRRDRLAQAVSWAKAIQDDRWNISMESRDVPVYNGEAIAARLRLAVQMDQEWFDHFETEAITPLRFEYEDYRSDLRPALTAILSALGEEVSSLEVPELVRQKQADATSEEWIERFTREHPELAALRFAESD